MIIVSSGEIQTCEKQSIAQMLTTVLVLLTNSLDVYPTPTIMNDTGATSMKFVESMPVGSKILVRLGQEAMT